MKKWVEGEYEFIQLDSGTIVKTLISDTPTETTPTPITSVSPNDMIKFIYYKEKGLI